MDRGPSQLPGEPVTGGNGEPPSELNPNLFFIFMMFLFLVASSGQIISLFLPQLVFFWLFLSSFFTSSSLTPAALQGSSVVER